MSNITHMCITDCWYQHQYQLIQVAMLPWNISMPARKHNERLHYTWHPAATCDNSLQTRFLLFVVIMLREISQVTRALYRICGHTTSVINNAAYTDLVLSSSSILLGSITRHASPCAWMVRSTELNWTMYDQIKASGSAGFPTGVITGSPPTPYNTSNTNASITCQCHRFTTLPSARTT